MIALLLLLLPAIAAAQPVLDLPPETEPARAAESETSSTVVGGYGEAQLVFRKVGPDDPPEGTADLRRFVLMVTRDLGSGFRVYGELEWEHAIACATCPGVVEAEQAFVEWRSPRGFGAHAGLIILPFGWVAVHHEPTAFNGVERPTVEQQVIPSTWREIGAGVFADVGPVALELDVVTAFDPAKLRSDGLVDARGFGAFAPADAPAFVGRADWAPLSFLALGASGYASDAGPNLESFDTEGNRHAVHFPVLAWEADARVTWGPLSARLLATQLFLPETGILTEARRADGSPFLANPDATGIAGTRMDGAYAELALDVLGALKLSEQRLTPFVRVETWNTQASMPDGFDADPAFEVQELTTGLGWAPIPEVVLKADLLLRDRRYGLDEWAFASGLGFVY